MRPPVARLDSGEETRCVRRARIQEVRGQRSPRRPCFRFSLFAGWVPCQWKVSLSETEDERASPLQNEGVDFEEREVSVKLKKYGKASGSYHARHAVSEPVVGVAHPRVTRISFFQPVWDMAESRFTVD